MCLLIVMNGVAAGFPILVASNRDELRARRSSPPGLFLGERRRILSPRDLEAGGTWIGVNDRRMFAGLTNIAGQEPVPGAPTRGALPHVALDADDLDAAVGAVRQVVDARPHNAFQLAIADGRQTAVLVHRDGVFDETRVHEPVAVLSNEHRLGELRLPGVEPALAPGLTVEERLDALAPVLLDRGESSGHRILKKGGAYGTVSSSLIAVPAGDPRALVWRFASGPPDESPYRNYGNLARRLSGGSR